jgi:hypothetical protein
MFRRARVIECRILSCFLLFYATIIQGDQRSVF